MTSSRLPEAAGTLNLSFKYFDTRNGEPRYRSLVALVQNNQDLARVITDLRCLLTVSGINLTQSGITSGVEWPARWNALVNATIKHLTPESTPQRPVYGFTTSLGWFCINQSLTGFRIPKITLQPKESLWLDYYISDVYYDLVRKHDVTNDQGVVTDTMYLHQVGYLNLRPPEQAEVEPIYAIGSVAAQYNYEFLR